MSSYGRDSLWDTTTWADLDEVVAEEAKRVRVGQKVFRTEQVSTSSGGASYWVSGAQIETNAQGVSIKNDVAKPLVEISVPFRLTPAQAEAEDTLHLARSLAREAAKNVALAEDHLIFQGEMNANKAKTFGVKAGITTGLKGLAKVAAPVGKPTVATNRRAVAPTRMEAIVNDVTLGMSELGGDGWSQPYALVLGASLYADASFHPYGGFEKTAADRFGHTLQHCVLSSALDAGTGLLVSLAGETVTVYTAGEPRVALTGQGDDGVYRFRVFERIRLVVRDPKCVRLIG
jgi:uncharacterized linocin/CFP29 family protein